MDKEKVYRIAIRLGSRALNKKAKISRFNKSSHFRIRKLLANDFSKWTPGLKEGYLEEEVDNVR